MLSKNKGFTLIELLVVISIISILAGLTLSGFAAARRNARDTQRKSDLAQYKAALEAFSSNNNSRYPTNAYNGNSNSSSGIFGTAGPIIIEYLPLKIDDPVNDATYRYNYVGAANGITYRLYARLEVSGTYYWVVCSSGFTGLRTASTCLY